MEKEFVPYTLALKLKQLEFDEPCFSIWKNDKLISVGGHWGMNITHSMFGFEGDMFALDECRAPTFQQAFRWFREKYNMDFTIITNYAKIDSKTIKSYRVGIVLVEGKKINSFFLRPKKDSFEFLEFKTYEEAELACLDKLIELVESELK
jgi:hypothetical protein